MDASKTILIDISMSIVNTVYSTSRIIKTQNRRPQTAENLKVISKCNFIRMELQYLEHRITGQGIETDTEQVSAISQLKPQAIVKEL